MTRTLAAAILAAGTLFVVTSCGEKVPGEGTTIEKVRACVSVPPLAYIVDRIGGQRVESVVLVPPGQNPHVFEVTPKDMAALSRAHIYFTIGMPIEEQVLPKLTAISRRIKIVDIRHGVFLRKMEESLAGELEEHTDEPKGEAEHHHGELDPHVWLNPQLVSTMAQTMCDEIKSLDTEHATEYDARLRQLLEDLNRLDESVREKLASHSGKTFLVFHPAFGYFADAYGLEQLAVEFEGKEPSARQLASIVETARLKNIRTIFVQKQFPSRAAQALAREMGASVVELDPLAYDYIGSIQAMAQSIAESFSIPSP